MNFVMLLREIFHDCTVSSPGIMSVICKVKEIVILTLSEHPSIQSFQNRCSSRVLALALKVTTRSDVVSGI
jgi:hypothetical protein